MSTAMQVWHDYGLKRLEQRLRPTFQELAATKRMKDKKINDVLIALRRLMRATDLHSRELVRTTGLTTPQLLLLQSIKSSGEVSIGKLAEDISLSQATVTSILDRLEQRGYVTRARSTTDKRRVHAYLTELGKQTVKKAPALLQHSFVSRFGKLESWEQNMIIASLQRIASMMDVQSLDAGPVLDVGTLDRQAAGNGKED